MESEIQEKLLFYGLGGISACSPGAASGGGLSIHIPRHMQPYASQYRPNRARNTRIHPASSHILWIQPRKSDFLSCGQQKSDLPRLDTKATTCYFVSQHMPAPKPTAPDTTLGWNSDSPERLSMKIGFAESCRSKSRICPVYLKS